MFECGGFFSFTESHRHFDLPWLVFRCVMNFSGIMRGKTFIKVVGQSDVVAGWIFLACECVNVVKHRGIAISAGLPSRSLAAAIGPPTRLRRLRRDSLRSCCAASEGSWFLACECVNVVKHRGIAISAGLPSRSLAAAIGPPTRLRRLRRDSLRSCCAASEGWRRRESNPCP